MSIFSFSLSPTPYLEQKHFYFYRVMCVLFAVMVSKCKESILCATCSLIVLSENLVMIPSLFYIFVLLHTRFRCVWYHLLHTSRFSMLSSRKHKIHISHIWLFLSMTKHTCMKDIKRRTISKTHHQQQLKKAPF